MLSSSKSVTKLSIKNRLMTDDGRPEIMLTQIECIESPILVAKHTHLFCSMKSDDEIEAMGVHILKILYSSALCHEFRMPVEMYYPHLRNEYSRIIKYPIDLGTLLMSTMEGLINAKSLRAGLHLIFSNCVCFNGGAQPIFDSVASHCDEFAGGLYEEIIGAPYRDYPLVNGFQYDRRLYKRRLRLVDVKDIKLNVPDLLYIGTKLKLILQTIKPGTIADQTHQAIKNICMNADLAREMREMRPDISDHPPVTLRHLFYEMIACEFILYPGGETESHSLYKLPSILCFLHQDYFGIAASRANAKSISLSIKLNESCDDNTMIKINLRVRSPFTLGLFLRIDDMLGELYMHMHERVLRGSPSSSVWARPYGFVWAQPARASWFPCMILAGGSDTTIPAALSMANLSRIPAPLRAHLNKAKPSSKALKNGSTPTDLFDIPPSYYLVEFFSTHDFGWVKADSVQLFPLDGKLPPNGKGGSSESIKSASEAMYQMLTEEFSYGFPGRKVCISSPYDYVEDMMPPTPDQLNQIFQVFGDAEKHKAILAALPRLDPILGSCSVRVDDLLGALLAEAALNATMKTDRRKSGDSLTTLIKGAAAVGKSSNHNRNRKRKIEEIDIAALDNPNTFDPELYQRARESLSIKRRSIIVTRQFIRWTEAIHLEGKYDTPDSKEGCIASDAAPDVRLGSGLNLSAEIKSEAAPRARTKGPTVRKTSFGLTFGGCITESVGDTAIHSTKVNMRAPIFFREHPDPTTRKERLRVELEQLRKSINC